MIPTPSGGAAALALRGYLWTSGLDEDRRRSLAEDGAVEIGFLGRTTLLVTGAAGVHLFYDTDRMVRHRAVPGVVSRVLFGPGAVHGLDGDAHAARKRLFLDVLDPEACRGIAERAAAGWDERAARWSTDDPERVYDAAVQVFGAAVLDWAGVDEPRAAAVSADLARIVDGFGVVGAANVRSRLARVRIDRWAREQVRRARTTGGPLHAVRDTSPAPTPLQRIVTARGSDGARLDERTAAVELVNVLRPTVAVAWLASFAAVALDQHPEWRRRVADGFGADDPGPATAFAHEVRRHFPFVPVLAARSRTSFDWNGFHVRRGQRVLLDVYGTDHGREWEDPWAFRPERFLHDDPKTYAAFVPQGGGRPETGHRCPGEGVTTALLVETLRALVGGGAKVLDAADQVWSHRRMPTRPATGVRVSACPTGGATPASRP